MELREPKKTVWQRIPIKDSFLVAVGILGALIATRDYFAVFLATPEAVISYPDAEKLNAVAGGVVTVPLTIFSEVRFTTQKIVFDAPKIRSGSGNEETLSLDTPSIPSIAPGQSLQITVKGTAPQVGSYEGPPEAYTLEMSATVKAGLIRRARVIHNTQKLLLWPPKLGQSPPRVIRYVGNTCEFGDVLYTSQPYSQGLRTEILVVSTPQETTDLNVAAPGNKNLASDQAENATGVVRKIVFQTPPLERFQEYRFKIDLGLSTQSTKQSCTEWSKKLDIHFD